MAHANTVIRSINEPFGPHCVDIFQRPDGSFGFELFRRDGEDNRGWYAVGNFAQAQFASADAALIEASRHVGWLDTALPG